MKPKATILLVDDHPVFRGGLIQVLRSAPSIGTIHEAGDGLTALTLCEQERPDVVVLDIEMPGMSGVDVAREIRNRGLSSAVMFITAYKDPELFHEAMTLGVKGYVLKESAVVDILAGIEAVGAGQQFISPTLSGLLLQRHRQAEAWQEVNPGIDSLSPSERRILKLISIDRTSKEIAAELGISPRTVENHRAHIAQKLQLRGSHSLLKFAFDNKHKL